MSSVGEISRINYVSFLSFNFKKDIDSAFHASVAEEKNFLPHMYFFDIGPKTSK